VVGDEDTMTSVERTGRTRVVRHVGRRYADTGVRQLGALVL
jgi:hypothetical protein